MKIIIELDEKRFEDLQRIASIQIRRRSLTCEQIIAKGIPTKGIPLEEYEKIIEKINFEERWMLDLNYKNELNTTNVKIAMSAIRHVLWQLVEEHKKGSN